MHPDAVPGVPPIPGVALGCPARNVSHLSGDRVEYPVLRRQVHRLPLRVVKVRLRPKRRVGYGIDRRVPNLKSPRAVKRNHGLAEGDGRNGVCLGWLNLWGCSRPGRSHTAAHKKRRQHKRRANPSCHCRTSQARGKPLHEIYPATSGLLGLSVFSFEQTAPSSTCQLFSKSWEFENEFWL